MTASSFPFADATRRVGPSAKRDFFGLLDRSDVISLAGGFPAQSALDLDGLLAATRRALSHTAAAAFQHGECEGYLPLREVIAQREAERGLKLDPRRLMITTGSQQAIDLVTRALINPGDPVFVEAPTYPGAVQAFRFHGANVVPVSTDQDGIVIEALETALDQYRPKMLYLIPNFANPTGRVLSLQRRNAILALALRHQFFIVEDDAYGELYFREPPPPSLLALAKDRERDWVVHLASFSKCVAPGLRLAWMTSSASLFAHLVVARQINDTHAAALSQLVAFHYLNAGSLEPALNRMRIYYRKQAQVMQRAIESELADTPMRTRYVPRRTGVTVPESLVAALSRHPNIGGLKDATGDLDRATRLIASVAPGFRLISGDDPTAFAFMAAGGAGVISVAANIVPSAIATLCDAVLRGSLDEAKQLDDALHPLYDLLASDTNPVPAKWLASKLGLMSPVLRAPLAVPGELAHSLSESVVYAATRDFVAHQ